MGQRRLLSYIYISPQKFFPRMHTVSEISFLNRAKRYCHPCNDKEEKQAKLRYVRQFKARQDPDKVKDKAMQGRILLRI